MALYKLTNNMANEYICRFISVGSDVWQIEKN